MVYWLTYVIVKFILLVFCFPKVYGRENVPPRGGFVLASNHISNLDPFLLGTFSGRALNFMAKDSLFKNKASAWFFRQLGTFPVKRDESDFWAMRESIKRLQKGIPLLIFPEGTRGTKGRAKKVQQGIAFLAVKTKLPVVPVYIEGADISLPASAKWPKFHRVKITFGRPLEYSGDRSYEDISNEVVKKIYSIE